MGSLPVSQASWGPQGFYTIPSKRPSLGIFACHEIKKPTTSQDVRHPYEPVGLDYPFNEPDPFMTTSRPHLRHVHSSTRISSRHLPLLHFLSTYTYSSDRLAWDFSFLFFFCSPLPLQLASSNSCTSIRSTCTQPSHILAVFLSVYIFGRFVGALSDSLISLCYGRSRGCYIS